MIIDLDSTKLSTFGDEPANDVAWTWQTWQWSIQRATGARFQNPAHFATSTGRQLRFEQILHDEQITQNQLHYLKMTLWLVPYKLI